MSRPAYGYPTGLRTAEGWRPLCQECGRPLGTAPKPTGYDPRSGRRVWDKAQVDAWAKNRPGQGTRTDRTTNAPKE